MLAAFGPGAVWQSPGLTRDCGDSRAGRGERVAGRKGRRGEKALANHALPDLAGRADLFGVPKFTL
jgi:hypothetical protein